MGTLAAAYQDRVTTVQHIEHEDRDPDLLSHARDTLQTIRHQVTAVAATLRSLMQTDHRYGGSRDAPMAGADAGDPLRQIGAIDGMGFVGWKPMMFPSTSRHSVSQRARGHGRHTIGSVAAMPRSTSLP